jgi:hypothetical protein
MDNKEGEYWKEKFLFWRRNSDPNRSTYYGSLARICPYEFRFVKKMRLNLLYPDLFRSDTYTCFVSSDQHREDFYKVAGIKNPQKFEFPVGWDGVSGGKGGEKDALVGTAEFREALPRIKKVIEKDERGAQSIIQVDGGGGGTGNGATRAGIPNLVSTQLGVMLDLRVHVYDKFSKTQNYQLRNIGLALNSDFCSPVRPINLNIQNMWRRDLMNELIAEALTIIKLGLHKSENFELGDFINHRVGLFSSVDNFISHARVPRSEDPTKTVQALANAIVDTPPLVELFDISPREFYESGCQKRALIFTAFDRNEICADTIIDGLRERIAELTNLTEDIITPVPVHIPGRLIWAIAIIPAEAVLHYTGISRIVEASLHEVTKDAKDEMLSNPLSDFVKEISEQIERAAINAAGR